MKSLKTYVEKGEFYKSVVDDGSDIVFVVDYDGTIMYHNASVRELGYRKGSLHGKSFFDFIPEGSQPVFRKTFAQCCRKAFCKGIEFQLRTRDNVLRDFEFNAINLKQKAGIKGLILDCRDITQRKRDAEQLLQAQKAKDLFLANISHEIRTPINGIAGMATLLGQNASPQEQQTYVTAIKGAAENLKVIINDILDLASIESGKVHFERIDFSMRQLLTSLLDGFRMQAREKGIELVLQLAREADRSFVGDPVRVSQILTNLVSNAIKFTDKGHIMVRCSVERRTKDQYRICFEVEDTGIGIPPSKLGKIFESFTQADASITRKYGGTGLGLTIARQLVESQKGKITVSSAENKGSVFTVVLPLRLAEETEGKQTAVAAASSEEIPDLSRLNILLVEDNEINRLYAGTVLKRWHCKVEMAENGKVAVDKAMEKKYDLILMDVQMPVMDGYEATRLIRAAPEPLKSTRIVGLTANAARRDVEKCLLAGMDGCVLKPFTPEQLYQGIRKFIGADEKGRSSPTPTANGQRSHRSVDLRYLYEASKHDQEFVKSMVSAMVASFPQNIRDISNAVADQDWRRVAEGAHKVKSSLSMIGLEESRQLVIRIEEEVLEGDFTNVPALAGQLCDDLERAVEELRVKSEE